MTPKEKAEELVIKYLNNISTLPPRCGLFTSEAKQCALIAANEITIKKYGEQVRREIHAYKP